MGCGQGTVRSVAWTRLDAVSGGAIQVGESVWVIWRVPLTYVHNTDGATYWFALFRLFCVVFYFSVFGILDGRRAHHSEGKLSSNSSGATTSSSRTVDCDATAIQQGVHHLYTSITMHSSVETTHSAEDRLQEVVNDVQAWLEDAVDTTEGDNAGLGFVFVFLFRFSLSHTANQRLSQTRNISPLQILLLVRAAIADFADGAEGSSQQTLLQDALRDTKLVRSVLVGWLAAPWPRRGVKSCFAALPIVACKFEKSLAAVDC